MKRKVIISRVVDVFTFVIGTFILAGGLFSKLVLPYFRERVALGAALVVLGILVRNWKKESKHIQ